MTQGAVLLTIYKGKVQVGVLVIRKMIGTLLTWSLKELRRWVAARATFGGGTPSMFAAPVACLRAIIS